MNEEINFDAVLETLLNETGSLKDIAEKSQLDPFSFYQGADLSGLDLSEQDLSGLNFERANFEGALLSGITYDAGAFNGAFLDERYHEKLDEFEYFIGDAFAARRFGFYFFARFRIKNLELGIGATNLTYGDFAVESSISTDTLRKARRGQIVSGETAHGICSALLKGWERAGFRDMFGDHLVMRQPFIEFLDLTPNGQFKHVSRRDFRRVYGAKIELEREQGPLPPPLYRSSFELDKFWHENLVIFEENGEMLRYERG